MDMVFVNVCLALFMSANFANGIGINWGRNTSHNLKPQTVAQLIKDNSLDSVKLYGSDAAMIKAFAKTGIRVMVGIPNGDLEKFSTSPDDAKDWVQNNIVKHVNNDGVNITYVAVGDQPFSKIYNGAYLDATFPAIKNIQQALNDVGLGDKIKATTPLNEEVYDSVGKAPSECDFRQETKDKVVEMVRWFDTNKSPFVLNINPFRSYLDLNFTEDSVFFSPNASAILTDKKATYSNVFDLSIDSLASSLKTAGVPNLKIIVGEIGWPSDGNMKANKTLAQRFHTGLLKKLVSNKGTPLRPGPMEVFLMSLLDEDMRSIIEGNHERHWGIYRFDGQPKYPIDFSGKGRDILPANATGVELLGAIYCIFDQTSKTNRSVVPRVIDFICKVADCTALTYGSSCNGLDFAGNLTYMFNMYFQMYNQFEDACNFNGMGTLSMMIPSTPTCYFPIQLKSNDGIRVAFGASEIFIGVLAMGLLALFNERV